MASTYQQHGMVPRQQQNQVGGLYKQSSSIYSRTLEELQNVIGEPGAKAVGSMNMDEFLRSIWSAEEQQTMAAAMAAGADHQQMGLVSQASAQRQSSWQHALPRQISSKTVDEVWRDISVMMPTNTTHNERQTTLGEMTLEDFLVKAGVELPSVVSLGTQFGHHKLQPPPPLHPPAHQNHSTHLGLGPQMADHPNNTQVATQNTLAAIQNAANQQQAEWLKYQINTASAAAAIANQNQQQMVVAAAQAAAGQQQMFQQAALANHQQQQQQQQQGFVPAQQRGAITAMPIPAPSPLQILNPPTDQSSGSQDEEGTPRAGRKRGNGEKGVERRQKRMIKNRESAARSRARKQAYTVELEAEITALKEDNERLQAKQIIEALSRTVKEAREAFEGSRKEGLRRTRSGPW